MTCLPLRIPMIRFSVSAVMNAPTTGPRDRWYGNWMVLDDSGHFVSPADAPPETA
jgi:hypothetical protein